MFSGDLEYLSNYYEDPITIPWLLDEETYGGRPVTVPTAEHAYQASKSDDWATQQWILRQGRPAEAKTRGLSSATSLRKGWDRGLRVRYMMKILNLKFSPGSELGARLVGTGYMDLINTNDQHEQFWGSCTCKTHLSIPGANMVGELLMVRRETLRLLDE
jgi:predicted NAD-dependent protein-ADP-ribosyltransferase YbiA (DUF1768 family)